MKQIETVSRSILLVTPSGTAVKVGDVEVIFEEMSKLSPQDLELEMDLWAEVLGKVIEVEKRGLEIARVEFPEPGSKKVKISYRKVVDTEEEAEEFKKEFLGE